MSARVAYIAEAMEGPNFSMAGRVALVTGAGRGIGLGIAKALASAGCAVAIQDIDVDVASAEADAMNQAGGSAVALGGDITDLDLAPRAVAETMQKLGGLHVLVNNAATQVAKDWTEQSVQEITGQVNADFIAPILFCQQAVPIFRRQRWGRILNIGSIQQKFGNPGMMPYAMCKAALDNMNKSLARGLARDGITVNLLAPGWFNTYRNRDDFRKPEDLVQKGQQYVPLGRIGDPRDCGGVALLLCSEAGSYITGQTIYVDGGISVRVQ